LLFYYYIIFIKANSIGDKLTIDKPIKDLSNWIGSLDFSLSKLKKNGLSSLKKILSTQNVNEVYIEQRIKELEQNSKWAIETSNLNLIRRVIKTKNIFGADISKEAEFLIQKESRAKDDKIINLNENKRLSDFSNEIISNINLHNKTLLNAPTGTGKSHRDSSKPLPKYNHYLASTNSNRKEKKIKAGNYAYISTTKATTGITIKNLKGIYQYGTIYSSNTFIQLLGRLRNGGFYIYIRPKFESRREHFLQNQIIGMVKGFQQLGVTKLSESFEGEVFQKWLNSRFTLPFHQNDLKGFLKVFQEPLRIIEANGLGQLSQERDDYIFRGLGFKNVEEIFESTDNISFKKYIDRVIIDWINNNGVEMLNDIYNLSFLINDATIRTKIKGVELITPKDKEIKRERRKEVTTQNREFYKGLEGKFQGCLAISTLKKGFSLGELGRLNEMDIDLEKLKNIAKNIDKMVFLKTQLIPKDDIFEITERIINQKGFCLVKELDSELQKEYIVNSRTKNVYSRFLIDLFQNKFFNNSNLQYNDRKEIEGKRYRNTITITEMRV